MAATKSASLLPLKERKRVTAACLHAEIPSDGWAYCATLAPDAAHLLIGRNGAIDVVDLAAGTSTRVTVEAARYDAVSSLAFAPPDALGRVRVVATTWVGAVVVLAWPGLAAVRSFQVASTRLHGLALLPDGNSAWVGGHDEKRTRVDLASGDVLFAHRGESMWLSDAALSPDGAHLVTGDAACVVRISDGVTGVEQRQVRLNIAHNMRFGGGLRPGEVLVPSLETAIVDVASGDVRARFAGEHKLGAQCAMLLDDEHVITGGAHDPLLVVWRRSDERPVFALKPIAKGAFEALVPLSPTRLVSVPRAEGPLQVWRVDALLERARA